MNNIYHTVYFFTYSTYICDFSILFHFILTEIEVSPAMSFSVQESDFANMGYL